MSLNVYTHQLTGPDMSNLSFYLDGTPVNTTNVAMDLVGGTAQSLNNDFGVMLDATGAKIVWDSSAYRLYSELSVRDIVRVIYDRS